MHQLARQKHHQRTLDAKPTKDTIVKPGELVDIVEATPLTLADRRIFNLLLANAWDDLDRDVEHTIRKSELNGTLHKGDRVGDSITRLMSAVLVVRVVGADGKWGTRRINLLGPNTEPDAEEGLVRYTFYSGLREIVGQSTNFARLQKQIMFALSSKYSLAMYEMIQKRGNMTRTSEEFPLDQLRAFLGVPDQKLSMWINFRNKALDPAIKEVSVLSDFNVTYETIRSTEKGKTKQIAKVRLNWARKDVTGIAAVQKELDNTRIGRKARLAGTVEEIDLTPHVRIRPDTLERARTMFPGYDVYALEAEWRAVFKGQAAPEKPDGAFIAWCKKYVARNPL